MLILCERRSRFFNQPAGTLLVDSHTYRQYLIPEDPTWNDCYRQGSSVPSFFLDWQPEPKYAKDMQHVALHGSRVSFPAEHWVTFDLLALTRMQQMAYCSSAREFMAHHEERDEFHAGPCVCCTCQVKLGHWPTRITYDAKNDAAYFRHVCEAAATQREHPRDNDFIRSYNRHGEVIGAILLSTKSLSEAVLLNLMPDSELPEWLERSVWEWWHAKDAEVLFQSGRT